LEGKKSHEKYFNGDAETMYLEELKGIMHLENTAPRS
jgi:hypothetical protein